MEFPQRRTSAPVRVALVAAVLVGAIALVAGGAISPRPRSRSAPVRPPAVLADGSVPETAPAAVTAAVAGSVVMARRLERLPRAAAGCATPWWERWVQDTPWWSPDRQAVGRFDEVLAGFGRPVAWVGTDALSAVRVGPVASPPGWPDRAGAGCAARWVGGTWSPEFLAFGPAEPVVEEWAHLESPRPLHVVLADVPEAAAWALVDRSGWWLAYPVAGAPRFADALAQPPFALHEPFPEPETRVVFLAADGSLLDDVTLEPSPPASGRVAAVLDIGPVRAVREALAIAPLRRCHGASGACVWVTEVEGELLALSAAGAHALSIPPFGHVGWCPSTGGFSAFFTGSQFAADGSYRAGPEPRGLDRYGVRVAGGRVVVDLSSWREGPARPEAGPSVAGEQCLLGDSPVGAPAAAVHELAAEGGPPETTWVSPSGDLTVTVRRAVEGLTVRARTSAGLAVEG